MAEIEIEEEITIKDFSYIDMASYRSSDNVQMARLNYMASRIRAALCVWANGGDIPDGAGPWWFGCLQMELVT
jgi:hypothetical protein